MQTRLILICAMLFK